MQRALSVAVVLLFVASPPAGAQIVAGWARTHDAPPMRTDVLGDSAVDASGNVWITGMSFNTTAPSRSIETVKYDASGSLLWRARYQAPLSDLDSGTAIAAAPLGTVVVAGNSQTLANASSRQTVVKYDALGAQLWAFQYGATAGVSTASAVRLDANGNIFVGGTDEAQGTRAMCVRKLDGNGIEQWTATYDGLTPGQDAVNALAFAPNGDIVAAGYTTWASNLALMRISANGAVLWAREVSGDSGYGGESALTVAVDGAGNVYAAGQLISNASTAADQFLVAYDSAGNSQWAVARDGSQHGSDSFWRVAIDPLGRVVAAGVISQTGAGANFSVAVYTPTGSLVWSREWNGPANGHDALRGMALDAAGNVYLCGITSNASGVSEGRVVAFDSNGGDLLDIPYGDGVKSEEFLDIEKGPGLSLYVGGTHDRGSGTGDYLTVRLDMLPRPFCSGDGSDAACPCGNGGATGNGCASSGNAAGARLSMSGFPGSSAGTDTLVLTGNGLAGAGLFLQGTGQSAAGAGFLFGDGLLCLTGTLVRIGVVFPTGSSASYPGGLTPSPIHVAGGTASGDVRHYQCWYRDAIAFCTASTFNLTQGLTITWGP